MRSLAALAAAAIACGSPEPPPAAVARPVTQVTYDEDPAGREVVARVDGVPVYADCVAQQTTRHQGSDELVRQAALDDCVGFELLAQEARRRGLTADPDAAAAQRREAVRALIDLEYRPTLSSPAGVPRSDLEKYWPKLQRYFNHDELRTTYYCRVKLKRSVVWGSPEDLEAKQFAERLYEKYRGKTFDKAAFIQICGEATAERQIEIPKKPFTFPNDGSAVKPYADATFALTGVGQVTPPVRTAWGWDLILLTEIEPPKRTSFAEAEPELRRMFFYDPSFEGYRENRFLTWSNQFNRGLAIKVYPERIPATEEIQAQALGGAAAQPAPPAEGGAPP